MRKSKVVFFRIVGALFAVLGFILSQVRGDAISITKEGVVGGMVIMLGAAMLFASNKVIYLLTREEEDEDED